MSDRDECRKSGCTNPPRNEGDAFAARFCSTGCELKHEHLLDDAREARAERDRTGGRF